MNHRLTISEIENAYCAIDPVFLNTPQFINEPLGKLLDCDLVLKVETLNPIRSFKGRGAEWLLSQSQDRHLLCASAGNFGQAIAYACRKRNVTCTVYASTNANPMKIERMRAFGAEVILFGNDFDAAKTEAKRVAAARKLRFVEDSLDIETLAGAGTIGLELLQFPKQIDALLIPLGNGAMINGIARIMKEKSPQTKIVAVQAAGAPAMVHSWQKGKPVLDYAANTIADGIAVRLPVPQALLDMTDLVDDALLVQEDSIIRAMKLLHLHAGLVVEPSGAIGIAALLEQKPRFKQKQIATIVCGSNLTDQQMKLWLG